MTRNEILESALNDIAFGEFHDLNTAVSAMRQIAREALQTAREAETETEYAVNWTAHHPT